MTRTPCILLVDDDEIGAELTLAALEELGLGIAVEQARDGEEALDLLFHRRPYSIPGAEPYLVLLDLKMPKIDGHEVLRQIRTSEHLKNLRVIVLSSSDQKSDIEQAARLNPEAYLKKPPSIFDLIAQFHQLSPLLIPPGQTR